MAQAAMLFAMISFVKFVIALIKLLYLQVSAKKCEGVVGALTNTECEYRGRKNQTMYTFAVTVDDESGRSSAAYQELVAGERDHKVSEGGTYQFYVRNGKAQLVKTVAAEPLMNLVACAVCIVILVVCFVILEAM